MQREVILRTAVEGSSHEEVAHSLGLSDHAVRGLVYRARATLRAAATAITPIPLLTWAGSRGAPGAPLSQRLAELTAGGSAGVGGMLLKGGAIAVTAGALATGTGIVHTHLPAGWPGGGSAHAKAITRSHGTSIARAAETLGAPARPARRPSHARLSRARGRNGRREGRGPTLTGPATRRRLRRRRHIRTWSERWRTRRGRPRARTATGRRRRLGLGRATPTAVPARATRTRHDRY